MQFSDWDAFVAMGGYGFYVWSAYGLSVATGIILTVGALRRHRHLKKTLSALQSFDHEPKP